MQELRDQLFCGSDSMQDSVRTSCQLCGSTNLKEIFSLSEQYVNDFPPRPREKGRNARCPLDIIFCQRCGLFQLRHTAPQELLYSGHYYYKSGINDTIESKLKNIAKAAAASISLSPTHIFLDIGANDGTLLSYLKGRAVRVGCEPATNLLPDALGAIRNMLSAISGQRRTITSLASAKPK